MGRTTNNVQSRFTPKQAARVLGIETPSVYRLGRQGVLTPIRPKGKGTGKAVFFDAAEVLEYLRLTGGPRRGRRAKQPG